MAKTRMVTTDELSLDDSPVTAEDSNLYDSGELGGESGSVNGNGSQERPKLPEPEPIPPQTVMGRPKGTPNLSPPENPDALRFPRPQYKIYKNDHVNQHQKPSHFFKYWNGLPAWAQNRSIIYVYRDHPVMLEPVKDEETGKPAWYKYIDKIAGNAPLSDALDILRRYGAGDYHLTFNDSVPKRKGGEDTLCQLFVTGLGGGDFTSSPPTDDLINDVSKVDLNHPANKSYVAYLRGRGLLPEQRSNLQGEMEMANVQILESVMEQNKSLTDRLVEGNKEGKSSNVDSALIGMMADGAKKSNEMVKESFTEAMNVMKEAAKAAAPAQNTPAQAGQQITLADVLTLVDRIANRANPQDAEVMQLRAQLAQMQEKQMERLMTLLEKTNQPVTPFTSMKEGVEALKTLKSAVDEISGRGGENDVAENVVDAAVDMGPKWLKTAAPLIQMGLQLGSQILGAWLMGRQQPVQQPYYAQPQPQPYPPQYRPAQGQSQPGPLPIQIGGQPLGQPPQPQPMQSQPQSQPNQQMPSTDPNMIPLQVRMLIDNILPALASHLTLGHDGTDFADWFILNLGEVTYNQVKGFGAGELLKALSAYPPSAQVLSGFPPEKVQALIAEFCDPKFDEGDEGDEGRSKPEPPKAA